MWARRAEIAAEINVGTNERYLRGVSTIPGDFRIRIGSLEPTVVNKEYINLIKNLPKLCRHAHLSVQSGSNDVLAAMGRNYTREEYIDIVDMLRDAHGNYYSDRKSVV